MIVNLDNINKEKIAAWAVHAFTASGAVMGFLAIISIFNNDASGAFLWLGLALFIDGIDGALARKIDVAKQTPNIVNAFGNRYLGFFFEINLNSFLFSIILYFFLAIIVSPPIVF